MLPKIVTLPLLAVGVTSFIYGNYQPKNPLKEILTKIPTLVNSEQSPPKLQALTRHLVRTQNLPGALKVRLDPVNSLVDLPSEHTQKLTFSLHNIEFCQSNVKVHQFTDGSVFRFGELPKIDQDSITIDPPNHREGSHRLTQWAEKNRKTLEIRSSEPCIYTKDNVATAVRRFIVVQDGLPYTALVTKTSVLDISPRFFHAVGDALIYPNNVLDDQREEFVLEGLADDGTLKNDYFSTYVDTTTYNKAIASDFNFDFEPGTTEFAQTSAFTNANRTLDWLFKNGYNNFGPQRISIRLHQVINGSINNALYTPVSGSSPPAILLSDGDGSTLQNLPTDADVVSHELGHHVVYHGITSTAGESLVLHEGLADYFTFARTGNACLGESICPANSSICMIPGRCLRSALNNIVYGTSNYPPSNQAHLQGQLISGLLWDLIASDGIPESDVTNMVLRSIDLMTGDSKFFQFLIALLAADKDLFASSYCPQIFHRIVGRGLESELLGWSCQSDLSVIPDEAEAAPVIGDEGDMNEGSWCGTIIHSEANQQPLLLWIIFLLPILISGVVRKEHQP